MRGRINDQWRIIFKWLNGEPHAVQIYSSSGAGRLQ